jgi:hypothetical protein
MAEEERNMGNQMINAYQAQRMWDKGEAGFSFCTQLSQSRLWTSGSSQPKASGYLCAIIWIIGSE